MNHMNEKASDFILAFRILKNLGKDWKDFEAYKLGLINDKGERLKSPKSKEEKEAYNVYNKIIFNMKRLLQKVTGKNAFAQRALSLLLLKESDHINERTAKAILDTLKLTNEVDEREIYEKTFVEFHCTHK